MLYIRGANRVLFSNPVRYFNLDSDSDPQEGSVPMLLLLIKPIPGMAPEEQLATRPLSLLTVTPTQLSTDAPLPASENNGHPQED